MCPDLICPAGGWKRRLRPRLDPDRPDFNASLAKPPEMM